MIGAQVIPVGLAFDRCRKEHPEIVLHRKDKRHPTTAGTYLAACVFFANLFEMPIERVNYRAGLARETALALQEVARKTCSQYQSGR